ncbi:hypothetical protein LguiB_011412 [Lonicera macranthoides]
MSLILSKNLFGETDPLIPMMNLCPVLSTPVDWKETPVAHVFIVDLPGLKKEDVKVELDENRVLKIRGERKVEEEEEEKEKEDKNYKWHCAERCRGNFCRRFKLPENAKVDDSQAGMENGVLTVTVAKQEIKKPKVKLVEIEEIGK